MAGLDEKQCEELLHTIHDKTSPTKFSRVKYLSGAVLPGSDADRIKNASDVYFSLKESHEYHDVALSLTARILKDAGSPKEVETLEHLAARCPAKYETDKKIPRLVFRELLASVAVDLENHDAERLVKTMARLNLNKHPDHFMSADKTLPESVMEAFIRMEQQYQLTPTDKSILEKVLEKMGRKDLIKRHLEKYNPDCPYLLVVIGGSDTGIPRHVEEGSDAGIPRHVEEVPWVAYRTLLIDTYRAMPEIPHNQWPPIKKAQYVSLALITSEDMTRDDLFSRNTVKGSVDDIMKRKVLVKFKEVFPEMKSKEVVRTLIEGRPGCGKTTLMVKVSKDWARQEILQDGEILVLVTLRRFMGRADITLRDILGVYCGNSSIVQTVADRIEETGGKGVYFVFDGLDEYEPAKQAGNLLCDIIRATKLPNAKVFMTSRPAGSIRFRNVAQENIEIIGFLEEQIEQYINDYYEDCPHKAASLIVFLKNHPNISRMCYLPLHLAMIVFLYDIKVKLPETETEMYKIFTLHTLFRALIRENPDEADEIELHDFYQLPPQKHPIFASIGRLAFEATRSQRQIFTGKEILEEKLLPVLQNSKDFDSLGLLTVDRQIAESSLPTKTFSFLHLTLQEFLSAVFLVYECSDDEQMNHIETHGSDVHMRVVWKFYCGLSHRSSMFLSAFAEIAKRNISNRLAVLHVIHCAYESTEREACENLLELLGGTIDVKHITLNPSDCSVLGYVATKGLQLVTELDLSYCHIGPTGIEAFVEQLQQVPQKLENVKTLRLRARIDLRPVGSRGAPALVTLLKKLPNLGELRLYGNELKADRFQSLAPVITSMRNIHTLILSRNSLDSTTGPLISEILEHLTLLHTFYISYNPIGSSGLGDMLPGLCKSQNLKILGLRGNFLDEKAGDHLCTVLERLKNLKWLILYQNKLGDVGVQGMLPGLYKAEELEELSLVENEISEVGALALCDYIRQAPKLERIRLYYNDISDTGKIALRTAVFERPAHLMDLKHAL